ncbi:sigma factor [Micromonospora sp. C28SCA-DRY-2]|uniref:sigma factor n=1 Tax=Micromonospora sp. C28SCA-DRY-2 TaxID=3059522 RepID=UPI0026750091|nr:sigma factor [Micromonospora sp. C28SCA-DRY-2]MDO3701604.1 sigma factor [Micromonospora sp. C28SCA-DRY-2]
MRLLRRTTADDSALTDADIIAWSALDSEIFGTIIDRHARRIHRRLARRLGVPAADELVAETFLAAFRLRGRFDVTRSDARPWLDGLAADLADQYRMAREG